MKEIKVPGPRAWLQIWSSFLHFGAGPSGAKWRSSEARLVGATHPRNCSPTRPPCGYHEQFCRGMVACLSIISSRRSSERDVCQEAADFGGRTDVTTFLDEVEKSRLRRSSGSSRCGARCKVRMVGFTCGVSETRSDTMGLLLCESLGEQAVDGCWSQSRYASFQSPHTQGAEHSH